MPLYTLTLTNVTRGWAYTATEGVVPSSADPVQLADDLSYQWAFQDGLVPSATMEPLQMSARLYCHTAGDVPKVDRGDELRLDLRLGTVGKYLVRSPAMLVTTVELDTDVPLGVGPASYTTSVLIRAADDTAQLDSLKPQPRVQSSNGVPVAQTRFRRKLTEIGQQIGRSVGVPSWWAQDGPLFTGSPATSPNLAQPNLPRGFNVWTENARQLFTRTLNDVQPGWLNHTLVPGYLTGAYPTGYATSNEPADLEPVTGVADPASSYRLLCVPAGRRTRGQAWPLVFAVRSGVTTLQPSAAAATDGHDPIAVDAAWCDLPVKLRRAREHVVNVATLSSWVRKVEALTSSSTKITEVDGEATTSDVRAGEQATQRTIPVQVQLGDTWDSTYISGQTPAPAPGPYATDRWRTFVSDTSQRAAWVYDAFTLRASRVPTDLRDLVLTRLAPRIPGETDGNGHVLKHMTIYRPAPQARPVDAPGLIAGFVVSGQLRVVNGDVLYTFTLTPGLPIPMTAGYVDTTAPTPVTVAQVDGGAYQAQLCNTLDPLIRVADLAYVAA